MHSANTALAQAPCLMAICEIIMKFNQVYLFISLFLFSMTQSTTGEKVQCQQVGRQTKEREVEVGPFTDEAFTLRIRGLGCVGYHY